ncbi:MAG TPA: ATP-dependent DNA helicase RecG [Candidatus Binataceae bacterium]|nr:ATP-dependent DNA helicase RecG [Candidatus Binataceae bacterium]
MTAPGSCAGDRLAGDVAETHGIGPKRSEILRARNIITFADALLHLPRRYLDLRQRDHVANLRPGDFAVVEGELEKVTGRPMRRMRWRSMTTAVLKDARGDRMQVTWFNLRGEGRMPTGVPLLLSGSVSAGRGGKAELVHPEVYRLDGGAPPPIRPIYGLPPEVSQRVFASIVALAFARLGNQDDPSAIPSELREDLRLMSVRAGLRYLHQPPGDADVARLETGETAAHEALALDEMFAFQLALARERALVQRRSGAMLDDDARFSSALISRLPFALTGAQRRAIEEIGADLARPSQMNRLLIGDVGSGKTVVALWAALRAAESGWQTAVMAPTELLAEQHFESFNRLCAPLGVTGAMLTAKVTGAERSRLLRGLARGEIAVVFGTHALIQRGVRLHRLGLAVIDEQHRFGVFDRARLIGLGSQANVLLMTATPIPRSLALTLFRNLEVSVLDEMPPGRTPVATTISPESRIGEVDALVRAEVEQGRRAYYVVPVIDDQDANSVAARARLLSEGALRGFRIGTLHGRMQAAAKEHVMREFRDGALDVLVATTVVEVGIDVPEATIIVVVAAERYGLAQLHQLRGRVGRGANPSRCCLVVSPGSSAQAMARLDLLARNPGGAEVAQADLALRGPGDLLGTRQSGTLPLRFARFIRSADLIERAGDMAEEWLRRDPELASPASANARVAISRMLDWGFSLGDVG